MLLMSPGTVKAGYTQCYRSHTKEDGRQMWKSVIVNAARLTSGGNTFQLPSSCRKKKMITGSSDRDDWTRTQRFPANRACQTRLTRKDESESLPNHFSTINLKDTLLKYTFASWAQVTRCTACVLPENRRTYPEPPPGPTHILATPFRCST